MLILAETQGIGSMRLEESGRSLFFLSLSSFLLMNLRNSMREIERRTKVGKRRSPSTSPQGKDMEMQPLLIRMTSLAWFYRQLKLQAKTFNNWIIPGKLSSKGQTNNPLRRISKSKHDNRRKNNLRPIHPSKQRS